MAHAARQAGVMAVRRVAAVPSTGVWRAAVGNTAAPAAVGAVEGSAGCAVITRRWQSAKPERPLSPHLTIYRFGLNAITSVGHRGTGIFMAGGLGVASMALMGSSHDLAYHIEWMRDTGFMLPLVKMAVAGPLVYHFMTGVRHIMWDNIVAHDLETSYKMSYGIIGLSALVTLGAAFAETDPK